MKNFLSSTKGRVISGVGTLAVIAAVVIIVLIMNSGYRTIVVDGLNGNAQVTNGEKVNDAFISQHLKDGDDVALQTKSDMTLALDQDKYLYAEQNSHFWVVAKGKLGDTRTVIHQDKGSNLYRIDNKLTDKEYYKVETPNATMAVRGTVFQVTIKEDELGRTYTVVEVLEGEVFVEVKMEDGDSTGESKLMTPGESATVWSDPTFSEFIKSSGGGIVSEIDYPSISQPAAQVLGKWIDDGRTLSITKELLFDLVGLIDHEFVESDNSIPATCQNQGILYRICTICGLEEEDEILMTADHVCTEWTVTKEPTETEDGERVAFCEECGQKVTESIKKLTTKSAQEEVTGGDSVENTGDQKSDTTSVAEASDPCAKGHTFKEKLTPATCTTPGKSEKTCTVCGVVSSSEIAATGHHYEKETTEATCTTPGSISEVCRACGDVKSSTVGYAEHDYFETSVAATCTADGYVKKTCKVCGNVLETKLTKLSHSYEEKVTKAATCSAEGSKQQVCSVCGDAKAATAIPKLSHSYEEKVTKAATCSAEGSKQQVCSVCGDTTTATAIAKLAHSYEEKVTKAATCSEEGSKAQVCSVCGDTTTATAIAKLAHSYEEKVTKAATCSEEGSKAQVCSVCGDTTGATAIAKLAHSYEEKVITAATCSAEGSKNQVCSVCGDATTPTSIAKLAHSYADHVITAATCTVDGSKEQVCSVCGDKTAPTAIAMLAHSYTWTPLTSSTCSNPGSELQVCSTCGGQGQTRDLPLAAHTTSPDWHTDRVAKTHYHTCVECGARVDEEAHTGTPDPAGAALCTVCGSTFVP